MDRRFNEKRNRGVDKFWSGERKRIKAEQEGTRNCSTE